MLSVEDMHAVASSSFRRCFLSEKAGGFEGASLHTTITSPSTAHEP